MEHALRFTLSKTRRAYVPPASHWANDATDAALPRMGMRVRLKANYDVSISPAGAGDPEGPEDLRHGARGQRQRYFFFDSKFDRQPPERLREDDSREPVRFLVFDLRRA